MKNSIQPNVNGVTLKDVTRIMNKLEKIVTFYNNKYNFDMAKVSDKERKEYDSTIQQWDFMKEKREELKSAA